MINDSIHAKIDEIIHWTVSCRLAIESEEISTPVRLLDSIVVIKHNKLVSNY